MSDEEKRRSARSRDVENDKLTTSEWAGQAPSQRLACMYILLLTVLLSTVRVGRYMCTQDAPYKHHQKAPVGPALTAPSPPYRTVPSCCFPRSIAQQTAWLRSSSKSLAASAERGESTKYTQVPPATQHDILSKQRLNRPIAPHLGAYKIEQTFLGSSAWMRITGCTLTGAIYVFFASYLSHLFSAWVSTAVRWWLRSLSFPRCSGRYQA
ncbi:unnamed protein product [Clonostachys rosea f. rosea IK726]|uniref:Uncharacterized protein n=1 Tax=Clonostachys rosea f. rosea IK726 TaxID=1349383 RepID=A0ACA9UB74_BIOOC|nr:unnamed protein product [Clonostachys rosea f. rosea IK726]